VSLGIGQGELGITPIQMANVMCIIANKGFYYTPHIIKKIGSSNEHAKNFKKKNYTTVRKEIFDLVYDGMQDVVERGTAAGARVPGIAILGKTGTAQNPHGKDHSLFVAFAPRENPRIAIGLMVENGGWGASWAAPIGTLMIEKYLNDSVIRKDLEKRMMEGVVYPPHYRKLAAGEEETPEVDKKGEKKEEKASNKENAKKGEKKEEKQSTKQSSTQTVSAKTNSKDNNKSDSKSKSGSKDENKSNQATLNDKSAIKTDNTTKRDKDKSNNKKDRKQKDGKISNDQASSGKSTETKAAKDLPKEPKP
jgi:penicillin-binding protein 2